MCNTPLQTLYKFTVLLFLGESDAGGEDFLGCNWNGTDTVEGAKFRPPSVCGLPKERGEQSGNFTVRWGFDMDYGGCSRSVANSRYFIQYNYTIIP